MSESWMPGRAEEKNFWEQPTADEMPPEESELSKTLATFVLLNGVPFSYLVPHERLLPENSIRFFHLDQVWVRRLLDGAVSLGRNVSIDYSHDSVFLESVYRSVFSQTRAIRPRLQKKMREAEALAAHAAEDSLPACTGFLLRSPLVRGWRGLEFKGYAQGREARALRIEALSTDVLVGLYEGVLERLTIMEPPEGLHFGFLRSVGGLTKTLRDADTGELTPDRSVDVRERRGGKRVIDMAATADAVGKRMNKPMTSALLALQMIQNPGMATFRAHTNNEEADVC